MPRIQHSAEMVKVTWLVHKDYVDQVLYKLGELKSVEFTEVEPAVREEDEEDVLPEPQLNPWESLQSRVANVTSILKPSRRKLASKPQLIPYDEITSYFEKAGTHLDSLEQTIQEIQAETAKLESVSRKERPRSRLRGKNLQIRLIELAQQEGPELFTLSEALEAYRLVSETKLRMRRTGETYLFQGWVPRNRLEETRRSVKSVSKGYGDTLKVEPAPNRPDTLTKNQPPTLLSYSRFTQVFQIFASLGRAFGLPSYYEVDPTIFFLASFPIIFGLMYGDIGHGLLLLAAAIGLFRLKSRVTVKLGSITSYALEGSPLLILCALSSIFFGFLFGELFGSKAWFTALTGLPGPLWFSPTAGTSRFLRLSIYVGIIQISFGLVLGALNRLLAHEIKEAVSGPLVWLWLYASGSYLVVKYGFKVFTVAFEPANLGLLIAPPIVAMIILKLYAHGFRGLNEAVENLLVSFSHSVSYVRILALKLVSSIFSSLLLPVGLIGFIPFAFGTFALILIFETLLVFLHTLRLHWIEWFSKFYQGTGHPFRPFTLSTTFARIA